MPSDAHRMYVEYRSGPCLILQCDVCAHRVAINTNTDDVDTIDRGDTTVAHTGTTGGITLNLGRPA